MKGSVTRRHVLAFAGALTGLGVLAACDDGSPDATSPRDQGPVDVRVSVLDHGAKGDGLSDDTAAFQRAIDSAGDAVTEGASIAWLEVPAGEYLITPSSNETPTLALRPGVSLIGEGRERSVLRCRDHSGDWGTLLGPANDSTDLGDLTIRRLGFDLNTRSNPVSRPLDGATSPRMCIRAAGGRWGSIHVDDCSFHDSSSVNTLYLAGHRVMVTHCTFTDTGLSEQIGWDHSSIYATARAGGYIEIVKNSFDAHARNGGSRTAIETHGGRQVVSENLIRNFFKAMNITGVETETTGPVSVLNNHVVGCAMGIHFWCHPLPGQALQRLTGVTVRGNEIHVNPDAWSSTPGIHKSSIYGACVIFDSIDGSKIEQVVLIANTLTVSNAGAAVTDKPKTGAVVLAYDESSLAGITVEDNVLVSTDVVIFALNGPIHRATLRRNHIAISEEYPEFSIVRLGSNYSHFAVNDNTVEGPQVSLENLDFVFHSEGLNPDLIRVGNNQHVVG